MSRNIALLFSIILISAAAVLAQTPASLKPVVVSGDVVALNPDSISIAAKTGTMNVLVTDKTAFAKVAPENLASRTPASRTDVSMGDKVTVSGLVSADGKSITVKTVYFMTKGDIAAKNRKETQEWNTRGIQGKVASVDPQTNTIVVDVRGIGGTTKISVTPKSDVKFLRYAPDSIRFDEAKASSISEIQPGDMIRALGDKSPDGTSLTAEKVLTGAFQTIAGTVKAVDPATHQVIIKNLVGGKDVTVVVTDTSLLKKYPTEMAERLAAFQQGGGGARPAGAGQARPANPAGGQGAGGRGFGGGFAGRGGNVDQMLDSFPTITIADLKPGDMIAISSTRTGNMDHVNAIKLLAGVEPFLRMAQGNQGGGRGRSQGVDGGFSIPGLDGVGFPD